jgi:hypothetical protein
MNHDEKQIAQSQSDEVCFVAADQPATDVEPNDYRANAVIFEAGEK